MTTPEPNAADRFMQLVKEITSTVDDKAKAKRLFDTAVQFVHAAINFQLAVVGSSMPIDHYWPLMDAARDVVHEDDGEDDEAEEEEIAAAIRAALEEQSNAKQD